MEIAKSLEGETIIFSFKGKFNFSDYESFRAVIQAMKTGKLSNVAFNLSELEFVDSAALGMFIVAREEAIKHKIDLSLTGAAGQVKKMFDLSNFNSLFKMS